MFHPTVVPDSPCREEDDQDDRACSSCDFKVHWSELLVTRAKPAENSSMGGSPEGLGVGEEGIDPRHQRRTPQIDSCPPIRQKLRRRSERQWRGMEEIGQVEDEEAGVRGELV